MVAGGNARGVGRKRATSSAEHNLLLQGHKLHALIDPNMQISQKGTAFRRVVALTLQLAKLCACMSAVLQMNGEVICKSGYLACELRLLGMLSQLASGGRTVTFSLVGKS